MEETATPPRSPRKRGNPLTTRQKLLVKNLAKGKTLKDAAVESGYSPNGAAQTATNALEAIAKKAPNVLERCGLTEDVLASKYLKPLLSATEERVFFTEGKFYYSKPMPALMARNKALDTAFRISGSYKADQNPGALKVQVVVIGGDHRPPATIDIPHNGNGTSPS